MDKSQSIMKYSCCTDCIKVAKQRLLSNLHCVEYQREKKWLHWDCEFSWNLSELAATKFSLNEEQQYKGGKFWNNL